jgi:hypothetical protein
MAPRKPKASLPLQQDAAVAAIEELIAQDKGRALAESLPDFMQANNAAGVALAGLLAKWAGSQNAETMSQINAEGVAGMMQGLMIASAKAQEVVAKTAPPVTEPSPQHVVGHDPLTGRPLEGEIIPPGRPVEGIEQVLAVFESRRVTKQ